MKKLINLSITDLLPEEARPFPKALFLILILSFVLNIIGINWGLPSPSSRGWAADEITPVSVLNGMEMKFSNGWTARFPPLHFYTLSLFYLPVCSLDALNIINLPDSLLNTVFFIISRLISVFMGTVLVFMVYLCGCEITDKRSALFASLITALTPPFVYYSKTSNTDIPYLFWFILALYFFIRILKYHHTFDYILFAAAAVFSICTKDQAYALFVLTPFIIIISLFRHNKAHYKKTTWLKSVFNRKTLSALITGTSLFVIIYNLVFNLQGFKRHFSLITGAARGVRIFSNDILGHSRMLWQTVKHLNFILSFPVFVICILGFLYALTRKKKNPLLFIVFLLAPSYYIFFISVLGRNYVRYLLPVYIILSFFGGLCLSYFLHSSRRFKFIKYLLVILLFVNSAAYSLSVDVIMVNDSRYYVEQWMEQHIKQDESILFIGFLNFLPRNKGFTHARYILRPSYNQIIKSKAHYIVFNSDLVKSKTPVLYKKIIDNEDEYKLVLRYKSSPWLDLLPEHQIREDGNKTIITNLNLINPEIMIFQKQEGS